MNMLELTADELLSTTRAVRKRLDFDREVPDEVIRECVALAMQSPSGSNNMTMQFLVVRDAELRAAIGDIYRQCYDIYRSMDGVYVGSIRKDGEAEQAQQDRVASSADYLGEHMGDAPAIVLAYSASGRVDGAPAMIAAAVMGNILPAMWSFMLAARARGLGTCWTTVGLMMEEQLADLLGVPFADAQLTCISPLAYTKGTDFKPAGRPDPDTIIHWDRW